MQSNILNLNQKLGSVAMLIWAILYFLLGYLSLTLDDPGNRVAFIWLPAGVAVSAFLISTRRKWPLLFISLLVSRLLLDLTFHHPLTVSLVLATISLLNDVAIAWCTSNSSRHYDEMHNVVTWIFSTIFISALAAVLGVLWLRTYEEVPLIKGIWIWWSANVTGTLFITSALVGLAMATSQRRLWLAYFLPIVVLSVTLLIFTRTPNIEQSITLTYALVCVPLVLVTITNVLCGSRSGSVAFILFSLVVLGASWYETGPFYIDRLNTEQSIILAQCYLSGAALLIVFIRAQKSIAAGITQGTTRDIAYSLDPCTGQISWNSHANSLLRAELAHISTRDELLACVPDEGQKSQLQERWQSVWRRHDITNAFSFTLQLQDHKLLNMVEARTLLVTRNDTAAIIGFWVESRPGLFKSALKGRR
ncbi:MASE1 domain-containing protein [Enterobacter asburiae]